MSSIDSLNFDVILNDSAFKKAVADNTALARKFNTDVSRLLSVQVSSKQIVTSKGVDNARNMLNYLEQIRQKILSMPKGQFLVGDADALNATLQQILPKMDALIGKTGSAKAGFSGMNASLSSTNALMRTLSQLTGAAFSVVGLRRFLSSLIDITGQFEVQRMALRNMLRDIDGADKIFEDLYRFSSDSTYRFSELAKYAKQLAAFNIDQNNLLETTKMLGDVASGVGVSMDRLILAYGHVKSSGFLRGIQLRSFSQNGVPILDELAKMFSELENRAVSLGEVFDKMTKREIPFAMVEQAFRNMTSEGGKFYQMQEVLAKTLAGQINILKGRWENMLAAVGQANSGPIKDLVSGVSNLISNYENFGKVLKDLIVGFGAYQAALITITAVTEGLSVATGVGLLGSLKKVGAWILSNPYAILAATIAGLVVSFVEWKNSVNEIDRINMTATRTIDDFRNAIDNEIAELDALYAKLKYATKGTKDFDAAKLALDTRFGPYIQQLRAEGVEVDNLATLYDGLARKIREATAERFRESATQSITKSFGDATDKIWSAFNVIVARMEAQMGRSLTEMEREGLRQRVMGNTTSGSGLAAWSKVQAGLRDAMQTDLLEGTMKAGALGVFGMGHLRENAIIQSVKEMAGLPRELSTAHDALGALGTAWKLASEQYTKGMSDATAAFDEFSKKDVGSDAVESAEALAYKIGSIVEGIKKYDADIKALREKAKTAAGITADEKQQLDNLITARKEQTDLYKSIMGVDFDKDTKHEETAAEKARKAEISDLKTNIALLEKYLSIYEKIEPIKGEKTAKWMADTIGGKPEDYKNLEGQIEALCASLRQLGDEGKEAADAVESRLGLDAASKLVKQFKAEQKAAEDAEKALNKYLESMEKWAAKESALEGTGVGYKIRKAIADYKNDSAKANTAFWENSVLAGAAYGANPTAQAREIGRIMSLWARDKAGAAAKLKNTISGLADDIFKDALKGYDLSHWNDKTLAQIREIEEVIESIELPEEIKELLKDFPEILAELKKKLQEQKEETTNNTIDPEKAKKYVGYVSKAAGYIGKAAASMKALAQASGDVALEDFASTVEALGNTLGAVAEGYQAGGVWGAFIAGGLSIFDTFLSKAAEMEAQARQLRQTIIDVAYNSDVAMIAEKLSSGVSSVFGDDFLQRVRNAVEAMDDAKKKSREAANEAEKYWSWLKGQKGGSHKSIYLESIADNAPVPDNIGEYLAKVDKYNWKHLQTIAKEFNMSLYDENGYINKDFVAEFERVYGNSNLELLSVLKALAIAAQENADATKQWKDAVGELFQELASDMTSEFIDNYKRMGNAVDDLGETFMNLGETILNALLKSYIIDNILKKYEKEAQDALAEYSDGKMSANEYASWLAGFTRRVKEDSERQADAINGLISSFANEGLLNLETESSDQSLGEGIKGITEETASLLASYINAMRADLSFMRALQEKGWGDVALIGGYVPTLNDYLQQIAANTYNNAQSAARILSELQAVIGSPDTSGQIVRVQVIP